MSVSMILPELLRLTFRIPLSCIPGILPYPYIRFFFFLETERKDLHVLNSHNSLDVCCIYVENLVFKVCQKLHVESDKKLVMVFLRLLDYHRANPLFPADAKKNKNP